MIGPLLRINWLNLKRDYVALGLTFVLPIGFISFYPAADFLGQDDGSSLPLDVAMWTPIVGVLMFTFAIVLFRAGLRRYESAGS